MYFIFYIYSPRRRQDDNIKMIVELRFDNMDSIYLAKAMY